MQYKVTDLFITMASKTANIYNKLKCIIKYSPLLNISGPIGKKRVYPRQKVRLYRFLDEITCSVMTTFDIFVI